MHVHDFVNKDIMALCTTPLPFKFWSSIAFGLDDTFWLHKKLIHNCHVLTNMDIPKPF